MIDTRKAVEFSARWGGMVKATRVDIERMLGEDEDGTVLVGINGAGHIALYFGMYSNEVSAQAQRPEISLKYEGPIVTYPVTHGLVVTSSSSTITSAASRLIHQYNKEWSPINPSRINWCSGKVLRSSIMDQSGGFVVFVDVPDDVTVEEITASIKTCIDEYETEKDEAHRKFVESVEAKERKRQSKSGPRKSGGTKTRKVVDHRASFEKKYGKTVAIGCEVFVLETTGLFVKGMVTSISTDGFSVGKQEVPWNTKNIVIPSSALEDI